MVIAYDVQGVDGKEALDAIATWPSYANIPSENSVMVRISGYAMELPTCAFSDESAMRSPPAHVKAHATERRRLSELRQPPATSGGTTPRVSTPATHRKHMPYTPTPLHDNASIGARSEELGDLNASYRARGQSSLMPPPSKLPRPATHRKQMPYKPMPLKRANAFIGVRTEELGDSHSSKVSKPPAKGMSKLSTHLEPSAQPPPPLKGIKRLSTAPVAHPPPPRRQKLKHQRRLQDYEGDTLQEKIFGALVEGMTNQTEYSTKHLARPKYLAPFLAQLFTPWLEPLEDEVSEQHEPDLAEDEEYQLYGSGLGGSGLGRDRSIKHEDEEYQQDQQYERGLTRSRPIELSDEDYEPDLGRGRFIEPDDEEYEDDKEYKPGNEPEESSELDDEESEDNIKHEPEDDIEVSEIMDGRNWTVDVKNMGHDLTADTVLCPSCDHSRTYKDGEAIKKHYKRKYLEYVAGMELAKWDKKWRSMYAELQMLLTSGCLTYRWKMEHGQMTPEKLVAYAREW